MPFGFTDPFNCAEFVVTDVAANVVALGAVVAMASPAEKPRRITEAIKNDRVDLKSVIILSLDDEIEEFHGGWMGLTHGGAFKPLVHGESAPRQGVRKMRFLTDWQEVNSTHDIFRSPSRKGHAGESCPSG